MITRIVKMTFREENANDFLTVFDSNAELIRNFKGCEGVTLLRDKTNINIFFTYSHWLSESDLELYRNSELFENVWGKVKQYFIARPEAWSCEAIA